MLQESADFSGKGGIAADHAVWAPVIADALELVIARCGGGEVGV